ncbi:hypothetical protein GCM10009765_26650 [Fodinicola feengrottensis]|uniref:Uncharacterized protein n=2 Tax=Fodinicola feengrottensis TaxID=435914 RepID=A0ABP4SP30_9ACTN
MPPGAKEGLQLGGREGDGVADPTDAELESIERPNGSDLRLGTIHDVDRNEGGAMSREALDLVIRHNGWKFQERTVSADPNDSDDLRQVLLDAIKRDGWDERRIDEFEMDVRYANDRRLVTTFAVTS